MSEKSKNFFEAHRKPIVIFALAVAVLVLYWQTHSFQFINLDDDLYVYENLMVSSGLNPHSIGWAFSVFHSSNYHPLTWLSHMTDVQLFGVNAGPHHIVSVLFHLLNSILAFAVFRKLTGAFWKSAMVAALFAVHPAHVESVAWVSERKDVLSALFFLLTIYAYAGYTRKRESGPEENTSLFRRIGSSYFSVLALFVLGMLAKPMLITLPFVLLLLDYWPLGRLNTFRDLKRLVFEKLPFLFVSAASAVVTVMAQLSTGAIQSLDGLPLAYRVENSLTAYAKYIVMLFYPAGLSIWYPYETEFPGWQVGGSIALLAGVTGLCIWRRKSQRFLLVGWLLFLGTLVPVIGLVQVGSQSMADRYTYIPYFGLSIMLVWGLAALADRFSAGKPLAVIFVIALLFFSVISYRQVSYWRSPDTLYPRALAVTKNNFRMMENYCHALIGWRRFDEAETQCQAMVETIPYYANGHNLLGTVQIERGEVGAAEESFKKAVSLEPTVFPYLNLAIAQAMNGNPGEAELNMQKAGELKDLRSLPEAWANTLHKIAMAYARQQKQEKAAELFTLLMEIAPRRSGARADFALTLASLAKYDEAQKQVEESIRQDPGIAESRNTFGLILLAQGRSEDAAKQFESALEIRPDFTEAQENLKKAREKK